MGMSRGLLAVAEAIGFAFSHVVYHQASAQRQVLTNSSSKLATAFRNIYPKYFGYANADVQVSPEKVRYNPPGVYHQYLQISDFKINDDTSTALINQFEGQHALDWQLKSHSGRVSLTSIHNQHWSAFWNAIINGNVERSKRGLMPDAINPRIVEEDWGPLLTSNLANSYVYSYGKKTVSVGSPNETAYHLYLDRFCAHGSCVWTVARVTWNMPVS